MPHRHRKISLRFLSWIVLQQDIQSSGSHDSVEDARTALQLFERYNQLLAEGKWESTLEEIYREGGRLVSRDGVITATLLISFNRTGKCRAPRSLQSRRRLWRIDNSCHSIQTTRPCPFCSGMSIDLACNDNTNALGKYNEEARLIYTMPSTDTKLIARYVRCK